MKKKVTLLFILFITALSLSNLFLHNTAKAQETATAYQISFSQYPSKTTYAYGESLDLSGMILISLNSDGTSSTITDYSVEGYNSKQIGIQAVTIRYQNCTAYFNVTVLPAKVTNVSIADHGTNFYTLTWDAVADVTYYEIYCLDDLTGAYTLFAMTPGNTHTIYASAAIISTYQIRAVKEVGGVRYTGEFSDPYSATTAPGKVESLTAVKTADTSVELSWSAVAGATGYSIYRFDPSADDYEYCEDTTVTAFTDTGLKSGTAYQYKVCAYIFDPSFSGEFSPIVDISTNPAKMALSLKGGDKKIRLTWTKVTGADAYDIYAEDKAFGYYLLTTVTGNANCTYTAEGLTTGKAYSFYAIASREYNGVTYKGAASAIKAVTLEKIKATNTSAKYFAGKTEFKKSAAYTTISFFRNNVNYTKSYVIPGLVTTNVGGFNSSTMCPQGIAFAKDYLLLTAYDLSAQEDSVIYVMDKASAKLITTLVLPTKTHVGGICYDGKYVWITTGTKVSAVLFSDIQAAAKEGGPYAFVSFHTVCKVGFSASYIAYYHDKLWVGSYDELKTTYMYSYSIDDYEDTIALTKTDSIKMPTRVQGIAFTKDGYLILSRSCQLYKGLRGYMHRIDVYQPDFTNEGGSGKLSLGTCLNYVYTPSMNEGIALNGSYLYVLFESGAFQNASYKMDRVCAFKLTSVIGDGV